MNIYKSSTTTTLSNGFIADLRKLPYIKHVKIDKKHYNIVYYIFHNTEQKMQSRQYHSFKQLSSLKYDN